MLSSNDWFRLLHFSINEKTLMVSTPFAPGLGILSWQESLSVVLCGLWSVLVEGFFVMILCHWAMAGMAFEGRQLAHAGGGSGCVCCLCCVLGQIFDMSFFFWMHDCKIIAAKYSGYLHCG